MHEMRNFLVKLVLLYLRVLARIQLLKMKLFFKEKPVIIGVGGASGKSSLSRLLAIVLGTRYKVLETAGKNSETGIPLSILRIKLEDYSHFDWFKAFFLAFLRVLFDWEKYDILIVEMGIDGPFEPKNMAYLLKIVRPKIGVLTNISFEHSVYFEEFSKNRRKILDLTSNQEGLLLKSLPEEGFAVLNIDDPNINRLKGLRAKKITVSAKDLASDFFIEKMDVNLKNSKVSFSFKSKKYEIRIPQPLPDHYAYSFVMIAAIASILGIEVKDSMWTLMRKFSLPPGRMSVFEGKNGTTIIDSSYNNATLSPVIDTLDLLRRTSGERRKVAVIGDMRELGVISREYHEAVAKMLLKTTDVVFLIGPLMRQFVAPILKRNKHKFYAFNTFSESKKIIKKYIDKDDVILVKGSQNTLFLERVVEMLLKNPKDKRKLARRGKFWDRIRLQTP